MLPSNTADAPASPSKPYWSSLCSWLPSALEKFLSLFPTRQSGTSDTNSLEAKSCMALSEVSVSDCSLQKESEIRCFHLRGWVPRLASCNSPGDKHKQCSSHWQSSFNELVFSLSLFPSCHLCNSRSRVHLKSLCCSEWNYSRSTPTLLRVEFAPVVLTKKDFYQIAWKCKLSKIRKGLNSAYQGIIFSLSLAKLPCTCHTSHIF